MNVSRKSKEIPTGRKRALVKDSPEHRGRSKPQRNKSGVIARDELKRLIDQLPDARLATVRRILVYLAPENSIPENLTPEAQAVVKVAQEVFEDKDDAAIWLGTPMPLLGNAVPIDLLNKARGRKRVEEILYRLAYGICS